ncbi:hypothetical protein BGW38_000464 [Lunasporangiospora selenospora]|uniref:Uncharacterized protein n=1 Tax=Lunasporangiospora selenospora TaxID=979761 RepID=A0A9P6KEY0_9FUNG|nr:hypothetical protein BGW38_000464 [Lunasporangiospora selenospora]
MSSRASSETHHGLPLVLSLTLIQNFIEVAILIQDHSLHGLGAGHNSELDSALAPGSEIENVALKTSKVSLTTPEPEPEPELQPQLQPGAEAEAEAEIQFESLSLAQRGQLLLKRSDQSSQSQKPQPRSMLNFTRTQTLVYTTLITHSPHMLTMLGYSINNLGTLVKYVPLLSGLTELVISRHPFRGKLLRAVEFIEEHRRVHPFALQDIRLTLIKGVDQTDFSPLILAMGQPRVIDVMGWFEAERYLDTFPSQECQVLLLRQGNSSSSGGALFSAETMAKFRHLHTVRMPIHDPATFAWANPGASSSLSSFAVEMATMATATSEGSQSICREKGHLRSANLSGHDNNVIPATRDIASGFRETIQCLDIRSIFGIPATTALSWDWGLPRLTTLRLEGMVAATFDLKSLQFCTALRRLSLNVGKVPRDWASTQKVQALADHLPIKLTNLELAGWWQLSEQDLIKILLPKFQQLRELNLMWCKDPGTRALMELIRRLESLKWIALSTISEEERKAVIALRSELGREQDLEIDIHIL